MTNLYTLTLSNESDTDRLGAALAQLLPPGTMVGLIGPLGAGKTRLVQGVAAELGIPASEVTSPTFVVIQEYGSSPPIYHIDAFRMQDEDEFMELGPFEYFESEGLTFVEWSNKVERCLPTHRLELEISPQHDGSRRVCLSAFGTQFAGLTERICGLFEQLSKSPQND